MSKSNSKDGNVINFSDVRKAKVEEKRRRYERVFFKNLLGAYCVAEGEELRAVELVDLSNEGLSFQLPSGSKNLNAVQIKKDFTFRMYFSEDSYIPVVVQVQNKRPCVENGGTYYRFGCRIDTTTQSYETYKMFVNFMQKYAETSHQDTGKMKTFFF